MHVWQIRSDSTRPRWTFTINTPMAEVTEDDVVASAPMEWRIGASGPVCVALFPKVGGPIPLPSISQKAGRHHSFDARRPRQE